MPLTNNDLVARENSSISEVINARVNIFFLVDCSFSMRGEKIALVNKSIRELLDFFGDYSKSHSIEMYIGVLQFDYFSKWLTCPSVVPLSSYKFEDIIAGESEYKAEPDHALQKLAHVLRDLFWTSSVEKPMIFLFSDGNFQKSPQEFKRDISRTIQDFGYKIPVAVGKYKSPESISAVPFTVNSAERENESMTVPEIDYNVKQLEEFLTDPKGDCAFPFRLVHVSDIVKYCKYQFCIPIPQKFFPRLHVIIISDCSSSMKGDKIALVNKGIQDLVVYLKNFSRSYSLDPYIGIIQLSTSARWLTNPEIVPLSSFQFQELEVIEGASQPSAAFFLLKPFLEKINRAFPVRQYPFGNTYWYNQEKSLHNPEKSSLNPEYPVIFFLSDGNFHESLNNLEKNLNSTISSKCIRIPILISKTIFKTILLPFNEDWKECLESSPSVSEPEKDYNFKLLDIFREDSYYLGRPIIPPVNIVELKQINDFFKIPFDRQDKSDTG